MSNKKVIKLDIVSGFLGAGKTTFVKKYLEELVRRGESAVYLVNDFGASIDDGLVGFQDTETLSGGCVCCTLKTDFLLRLNEIGKRKPDRIVFETSGIFLFSDILSDLQNVTLNSIITVADGRHFFDELKEFRPFIENQLKYSTHALISKSPDKADHDRIANEIRALSPDTVVLPRSTDELTLSDYNFDSQAEYAFCRAQPHFAPDCFSMDLSNDFSPPLVTKISNCFRDGYFGKIIRAKAILKCGGKMTILNVVGKDISLDRTAKATDRGRIAVMGQLDVERLTQFFK